MGVYGDDVLLVGVGDGTEVERILVLAVVDDGALAHEGLLQPAVPALTLTVADSPKVDVELVHFIVAGDAPVLFSPCSMSSGSFRQMISM